MRKILTMAAVLVVTAAGCGSDNAVSVSTAGGQTATTNGSETPSSLSADTADTDGSAGTGSTDEVTGSEQTIPVNNLNDIPDECVELFGEFLKQIEPIVSPIDWNTATVAQFGTLGDQFQAESDALDAKSKAVGCDKYSLQTTDPNAIKQLAALAASVAPGTVAFINFMGTFSATTPTTLAAGGDCDGIIAQVEAYLNTGKTIKDLTITEVTAFYGLLTQVSTACPQEKATAFYDRADLQAFANA